MADKPVSPVDEKVVKAGLKDIADKIDILMPHINKAQTAFGGLDEHLATLQDLKAKVAKARSIYGA